MSGLRVCEDALLSSDYALMIEIWVEARSALLDVSYLLACISEMCSGHVWDACCRFALKNAGLQDIEKQALWLFFEFCVACIQPLVSRRHACTCACTLRAVYGVTNH